MKEILKSDNRFKYQMLSRFESDCKYFLGNGNMHEGCLWANDLQEHIQNMIDLYNSFKDEDKPQWISLEKIAEYKKRMLGLETEEEKQARELREKEEQQKQQQEEEKAYQERQKKRKAIQKRISKLKPNTNCKSYNELKEKHTKEINNFKLFPVVYAFSNQQFKEAMQKLGLTENDKDQVCSIYAGGFCKIVDAEKIVSLLKKHKEEHKQAIANDKDGTQYIFNMFNYELSNHEYTYTMSTESTLDALGFDHEEIAKNENLENGLNLAIKHQQKWAEKNGY